MSRWLHLGAPSWVALRDALSHNQTPIVAHPDSFNPVSHTNSSLASRTPAAALGTSLQRSRQNRAPPPRLAGIGTAASYARRQTARAVAADAQY